MRALRGLIAVALAALAVPAAAGAQEGWRLGPPEAIGVASGTPQVRAERAAHARTYLRAFRERQWRWRVSLYLAPAVADAAPRPRGAAGVRALVRGV